MLTSASAHWEPLTAPSYSDLFSFHNHFKVHVSPPAQESWWKPGSGHSVFERVLWAATLQCLFIQRPNRQKQDPFKLFMGPRVYQAH